MVPLEPQVPLALQVLQVPLALQAQTEPLAPLEQPALWVQLEAQDHKEAPEQLEPQV